MTVNKEVEMIRSGTATSADGTELKWELEGKGPALIMVDPILVGRDHSPIAELAEQLRDSFAVCRFDRRGKGESTDVGEYFPEREVDDLRAVIHDAGIGPAPITFGFSSGGSLALLAAVEPQNVQMSSLVVVEPPVDLPRPDDVIDEINALIDEGREVDAILRLYRHQGMPEDVIEQMVPMAETLAGNAGTIAYDLRIIDRLDRVTLSKVGVRTLAVTSESSPPPLLGFVEAVADCSGAATRIQLEGDWHGVSDRALVKAISEFAQS